MVNARLLELIKNPDLLAAQDFDMIKNNSAEIPYAQCLRALELLAAHKFQAEIYPQKLSETAAYTTDKKILYQLINGKKSVDVPEIETPENKFEPENVPELPTMEKPAPVYISGELNRILFEGEEDFLERENPVIDLESTMESGKIVMKEAEKTINPTEDINETAPDSGSAEETNFPDFHEDIQILEDETELNFHGTDEFLPAVKIVPAPAPTTFEQKKQTTNRHDEEMFRLIAEVEAKMQKSKAQKSAVNPDDEPESNGINFSESAPFEPIKTVETVPTNESLSSGQPKTDWKPMIFKANMTAGESFDISESNNQKVPAVEQIEVEESNVPQFIDTWKAWLKLEKTTPDIPETFKDISSEMKIVDEIPIPDEASPRLRDNAIEKFIETEPKISRLKEDGNYIFRDKNDDISHLMTETLANLYVEQKLYSKAINGYEILKKKFPEKARYFNEKIKVTREMRPSR